MQQVLREEEEMEARKKEDTTDLAAVPTDDESENIAYEAWKLREMKRLKRTRLVICKLISSLLFGYIYNICWILFLF